VVFHDNIDTSGTRRNCQQKNSFQLSLHWLPGL
jgi:hypothetical protein